MTEGTELLSASPDLSLHGSGDSQEPELHDLLIQCATNLTEKAAKGDLPKAYGRDQEVEQILTALASPIKGRIVVTGGARVGKTAIIQEVAARITAGQCPDALRGSELWGLSARSVLRAYGVKEWQENLGRLMQKWEKHPEIILYFDALPTTLAAGATDQEPFDMAQFLLSQLQSSDSRILTEGRTQAVQTFLDAYHEFRHVLMEVKIVEPSSDIALDIIQRSCADLETSQGVVIEPKAVHVAFDLTRRFVLNERLPGKTIDLIAEVIALRSEQRKTEAVVTGSDIVTRFGEKTGLPRMLLTEDEPYDEQTVRRYFCERVLGQERVIDVVVQALSLLRTRLNNPNRPMAVLLFIGPTGVGKTELARALSQFLFGSDEHLVRFNMADYAQDWDAQTLFGDPTNYSAESRRGQFTIRMQDHAFAVILLDEFEKANPEVFQRFLQLFDEGMLINGASEMVNLRNSIVILTSNFGVRLLATGRLGFGPAISLEDREQHIREEMVKFFTPEFINRVDSVSFFKPLDKPILREIAYRRVQEVLQREGLSHRGVEVEVEEDVIDWVVEHGYSERYGARYLAREIEKTITYPLAQQLIRHNPPTGSLLRLFVRDERIASGLVLPETSQAEERIPQMETLTDVRQMPRRLTPAYMQAGLPLLRARVEKLEETDTIVTARARLAELLQAMSRSSFWDDPEAIQPRLNQLSLLSGEVDLVDGLRRNLEELEDLIQEMDKGSRPELTGDAAVRYRYLVHNLPRAETVSLFTGPYDAYGAYVRIEAQGRRPAAYQWVAELGQMYLKWAKRREFSTIVISEDLAADGLISGLWLGVGGYGAYGLLRGEAGIHRLVQGEDSRGSRRQTLQSTVVIWPDLPETELPTYDRAVIGSRIQNINQAGILSRRLTAQVEVRLGEELPTLHLTGHLPANDLVEEAISLLRIMAALGRGEQNRPLDPVWGTVVRSYMRHKQRSVHDLRTGLKTGRLKATLNGDIDGFLDAYLRLRADEECANKAALVDEEILRGLSEQQ